MEGSQACSGQMPGASHRVPSTTKDTTQKASELHSEGKFMVTSGDRKGPLEKEA